MTDLIPVYKINGSHPSSWLSKSSSDLKRRSKNVEQFLLLGDMLISSV